MQGAALCSNVQLFGLLVCDNHLWILFGSSLMRFFTIVVSETRFLFFLGALLFLGACSQSISTSVVVVDEAYLTNPRRSELVGEVYQKAAQFGGACKLANTRRQFHSCPLESGNPSLRLSVGYNPKGDYRIAVTSTFGHWFPQSDRNITSGKFIGNTQKELEEWMRSLVPHEAIIRAQRSYLDQELIENL